MLRIIHDSEDRQITFFLEWRGQELTHILQRYLQSNSWYIDSQCHQGTF